jgi:hypothetical protein
MVTICILVYVIEGLLLGWISHVHLNTIIEQWKKRIKIKLSDFGWISHYLLSIDNKNLGIVWKWNYLQ